MSRRFGVEIEFLGMTCTQAAALLNANDIACSSPGYSHRVVDTWKAVTDSSIGRGGCELVSPPMSGEEGMATVRKVITLLNEAGCDVKKSCGMHVHIEANDLTAAHIANVYNRYRNYETQIDTWMPTSRRASNNIYCSSLKNASALVAAGTPTDTARLRRGRFCKVNLCSFVKYGTIEFRQHGGTLNAAKAANWINFLMQFVVASGIQEQVETETATTPNQSLRGHNRSIVDILAANPNGISAARIAEIVGTTKATVQSVVCRLRRRGWHISTGRVYRMLAGETSTGTMRVVAISDSLFQGIDRSIKNYFDRRATLLAA